MFSYSDTVIGKLAVDGWAVTFGGLVPVCPQPQPSDTYYTGSYIWYNQEGTRWAVSNVTAHPSATSVPTSYYVMWQYNCLWIRKS